MANVERNCVFSPQLPGYLMALPVRGCRPAGQAMALSSGGWRGPWWRGFAWASARSVHGMPSAAVAVSGLRAMSAGGRGSRWAVLAGA